MADFDLLKLASFQRQDGLAEIGSIFFNSVDISSDKLALFFQLFAHLAQFFVCLVLLWLIMSWAVCVFWARFEIILINGCLIINRIF